MEERNYKFIMFTGQMLSLLGFGLFFVAFMGAYYSPTKTAMININSVGEAEMEYWLAWAMLVFSSLTAAFSFRDFVKAMLKPRGAGA